VGRIIAKAAEHLTPVALELGSKCPCIVDWLDGKRDSQVHMPLFFSTILYSFATERPLIACTVLATARR
jgi:hypothetical protein